MRKHLQDGQLRAALDGELNPAELHHLEGCTVCQTRQTAIRAQTEPVAHQLTFLTPAAEDPGPAWQSAIVHFRDRNQIKQESNMIKKLFAMPAVRFGFAAFLILVLVISIPQTRALADQLLSQFRVQQVTVIPVDFTGIQQLTGNGALGKQVSELISSSINVTQKPGDPVTVADASEASQLAGFTVRLPRDMQTSRISVEKGSAFTVKVDKAKAQALLKEAGRSDLVLPDSVDGADISVNIPAGVSAAYNACPEPKTDGSGGNPTGGSASRKYPDCIILAEIPSPTVDAPADLNIAQLAQIGLEFTGMSQDQAAAFTKTVDWTTSLVIPIPKNAAKYEQMSVDGVTGTLIQRPSDDAPQYVLIWVKDGIIYTIGGLGSDSQKAIQMANSLP